MQGLPQAALGRLIDGSLAVAIAAAAGYLIFRLHVQTEAARRAQAERIMALLIEGVVNRLTVIETKLDALINAAKS